jgi:glucose-6-phosphate 1-dehydrogenase
VATRPWSDEDFRKDLDKALRTFADGRLKQEALDRLLANVTYVQGNANDPATYERLGHHLETIEKARPTGGNRLFYLAMPPALFAPIALALGHAGLTRQDDGKAWRRLVVEKPFGTDLASAQKLNHDLLSVLSEDQIYRIDHYLGKETVQNIMVLRFANGLFEPIWNRHHIDHVQITVAETVGVEQRGRTYETLGALRDMVPNHLFQLLALVAMEPPARFEAEAVRGEKAEILDAIRLPDADEALRQSVRAQYRAGTVAGKPLPDYRQEPDVAPGSTVETYVALKLAIDNWRWAGVPFYLRTGKALSRRDTEVAIKFRQAPFALFRDTPVDRLAQNFLVLGIQPEECITLEFNAKVPGPSIALEGVGMNFNYKAHFDQAPSTGYETLLYDCMVGDATLFQRADGVEAGWRAVEPFLEAWQGAGDSGLAGYAAGSDGPREAARLLTRDGRHWRPIR